MHNNVVSIRAYVLICLVLLGLTGLTVTLAHVNLGALNSPLALAIAAAKAVLIAWWFMHLRWSPPVTRLVGIAGLLWLSILIVGTMDDVLTRNWLPIPGK